jgi:type III restriction enzyme
MNKRAEIKAQAAQKWVNAVNADRSYGRWAYALVHKPSEIKHAIEHAVLQSPLL